MVLSCVAEEVLDEGLVSTCDQHAKLPFLVVIILWFFLAQGFHKILKKHDKLLPHAPCQQFYIAHLHHQPWVQARVFHSMCDQT